MTRSLLALILEVLGAAVVCVGAALIYPPAGVVLAGLAIVVFALALDPPQRGD